MDEFVGVQRVAQVLGVRLFSCLDSSTCKFYRQCRIQSNGTVRPRIYGRTKATPADEEAPELEMLLNNNAITLSNQ
jgi:hypothetical protein